MNDFCYSESIGEAVGQPVPGPDFLRLNVNNLDFAAGGKPKKKKSLANI